MDPSEAADDCAANSITPNETDDNRQVENTAQQDIEEATSTMAERDAKIQEIERLIAGKNSGMNARVWIQVIRRDRMQFHEDCRDDSRPKLDTHALARNKVAQEMCLRYANGIGQATINAALPTVMVSVMASLDRIDISTPTLAVVRKYADKPVQYEYLLDLVAHQNSTNERPRCLNVDPEKLAQAMGITEAELKLRVERGEKVARLLMEDSLTDETRAEYQVFLRRRRGHGRL